MSDGALSQAEIEALLQGANEAFNEIGNKTNDSSSGGGLFLNDSQRNALLDVVKIIFENEAFSLSSISTKNVTISGISIETADAPALKKLISAKSVEAMVEYTGNLSGKAYYYLRENEAIIISGLMMGQQETELTDMVAQVLSEAFSQMAGVADSALISKYGGNFSNMPIDTKVISDPESIGASGDLVIVKAKMSIEGLVSDAPLILVFENQLANAMLSLVQPKSQPAQQMPQQRPPSGASQVGIHHADFGTLSNTGDVQGSGNIGLLMDVTMHLTVELGRAQMTIREILGLGEGSIIELQKLAGEPVDLLVNDKLIAKGEVVVIDENFGVRVTDIINPMDRFANKSI